MSIVYTIISFFAGVAGAFQSAINGQLKLHLDDSILTSFFSFIGGTILLGILVVVSHVAKLSLLPTWQTISDIRWWMWIGGPLGVICVMASILMPQKIGFSAFFGTLIAGQLIAGVLMDHFGIMGNPIQSVSMMRVFGVIFLLAGVVLIQKS